MKGNIKIKSYPYCNNTQRYRMPCDHLLHKCSYKGFIMQFIYVRSLSKTLKKCYNMDTIKNICQNTNPHSLRRMTKNKIRNIREIWDRN